MLVEEGSAVSTPRRERGLVGWTDELDPERLGRDPNTPGNPLRHLTTMTPRALPVLATLLLLQASSAAANPAERLAVWEWSDVPKVVAVGDIHGGYDKLVKLLASAELVDEALRWKGGEAHLVVAGDILDRGDGERPLMDLLRRLQDESEAAGGRVHVLLGNHEVMNLVRDTRDASKVSMAAFADLESKQDRKAALKSFLAVNGSARRPSFSAFNERFPRGFFGRQKGLDRDGEYGRWLLRQPVIVKVNGIAYVHGGLTEEFASLGVDGINRRASDELTRHLEQRRRLEEAGVVTPVMGYLELRQAVAAVAARKQGPSPELRQAAQAWLDSADSPVLGARGPLWYRGNSFEDERIEARILDRCLELVEAEAIVVAHSYTGGNRITSRFQGQLFRLDHGLAVSPRPLALVVERGEIMVLNSATRQLSAPFPEPPNGLAQPPESVEIADADLEDFLLRAPITESRDLGRGRTRPRLVVLEKNGERRRGIFKSVEEPADPAAGTSADRYHHEVAAYRLDRRLGLDLVPVTVMREIDGREGSLQWWVKGAVDQKAAATYGLELCATADAHLARGRVFDALIGNKERDPSDVLCVVQGERVYLIDYSEAFPTSSDLPGDGGGPFAALPGLAAALRGLDRQSLEAEIGELLDDRQTEALLARRDKLLALLER